MHRKDKGAPRTCPACNKVISSRSHLCSNNDEITNSNAATLNPNSLARDNILATMESHNGLFTLPNMTNTNLSPIAQMTLISNPSESIVKTCYKENINNNYNGILKQQHNDAFSTTLLLNNNLYSPKPLCRSNLSLASLSLRASNLTIDSGRNATSSV